MGQPAYIVSAARTPMGKFGGSLRELSAPDLVEKYTQFLEAQWEAHQALAQRFTKSTELPLTPEQIETLRSLGYVQ